MSVQDELIENVAGRRVPAIVNGCEQIPFKGVMAGAIYTPAELFSCLSGCADTSVAQKLIMYLRFCGPWILTVLFYLAAQVRTIRWARTMLRRLGIIT